MVRVLEEMYQEKGVSEMSGLLMSKCMEGLDAICVYMVRRRRSDLENSSCEIERWKQLMSQNHKKRIFQPEFWQKEQDIIN